jgi:hypothetical protein
MNGRILDLVHFLPLRAPRRIGAHSYRLADFPAARAGSGRSDRSATEETAMSTPHPHDDETGPIPWVQQLLDNPFLLLFLGVMVPMVVYTVWGVYDILTLPVAK